MNLTFIHQLPGLSGAACAQMILHAQIGTGIGISNAEQNQLWAEIQDLTHAPKDVVQVAGTTDNSACIPFANKICECKSNRFCWCTFPTALRDILKKYSPTVDTKVIYSASEDSINAKIADCIATGVAPAVLVQNHTHWVVVQGFDETIPNGVDVLDPEFFALKTVDIDHWTETYLDARECGKYKNKYVVVGSIR